jgi:hypothetical protein
MKLVTYVWRTQWPTLQNSSASDQADEHDDKCTYQI